MVAVSAYEEWLPDPQAIVPRTERTPIDGCQFPPIFQDAALREAQAMAAAAAFRVVPDGNFDDWVVRPDIG